MTWTYSLLIVSLALLPSSCAKFMIWTYSLLIVSLALLLSSHTKFMTWTYSLLIVSVELLPSSLQLLDFEPSTVAIQSCQIHDLNLQPSQLSNHAKFLTWTCSLLIVNLALLSHHTKFMTWTYSLLIVSLELLPSRLQLIGFEPSTVSIQSRQIHDFNYSLVKE